MITSERVQQIRDKFPVKKTKPPAPKYSLKSALPAKSRLRRNAENQETYVYFIQGERSKYVKIGYTHDLAFRIASFQVGAGEKLNYIGTILFPDQKTAEEVEGKLHEKFAHFRLHGEWFLDAPEVLEFVKTHKKNDENLHITLNSALE